MVVRADEIKIGMGGVLQSNPSAVAVREVRNGETLPITIARLTDTLYLHTCPRCNWQLEAETNEPVEHTCGSKKITRLGDRIEHALESVGITKEKYVGWKEMLGLPPTCGCASRQNWINEADEKLGLGEKVTAFKSLMGW